MEPRGNDWQVKALINCLEEQILNFTKTRRTHNSTKLDEKCILAGAAALENGPQ